MSLDPMPDLGFISQTDVVTYARCPREFHFRRIECLVPNVTFECLSRGRAIALCMEAQRKGEPLPEEGIEPDWRDIAVRAFAAIPKEYESLTKMTERRLYWEGDLGRFQGIAGTPDDVVRSRRTGLLWIEDDKSRKTLMPPSYDEHQLQAPLYAYLAHLTYGIETAGSITYQIRAEVERTPKVNKTDKRVSKAACLTTKAKFREALVNNGQEADDPAYTDLIAKLPESFDVWTEYPRSKEEQKQAFELTKSWAQRISSDPAFLRVDHPTVCSKCAYRDVCDAERQGRTRLAQIIKKNNFHHENHPEVQSDVLRAGGLGEDDACMSSGPD